MVGDLDLSAARPGTSNANVTVNLVKHQVSKQQFNLQHRSLQLLATEGMMRSSECRASS